MLNLLYTSTKAVTNLGLGGRGVYLASWDALLYDGSSWPTGIQKIFKDGTVFWLSDNRPTYLGAATGKGAALVGGDIYLLDEISGLPDLGQRVNQVSFSGKASGNSLVDPAAGLVYTPYGSNQIRVYRTADGTLARTLTVAGGLPTGAALHDGGAARLFVAAPGRGAILLVDRLDGTVTFQGQVNPANRCVVYDTLHQVVLVLLNSGQVAVYALEQVGYALANPTLSPAPTLYGLSRVTTRLTGADGQGVAGQLVRWWLAQDKGWLEYAWTVTDDDGYAYNWYYGPTSGDLAGEETLYCEVTV